MRGCIERVFTARCIGIGSIAYPRLSPNSDTIRKMSLEWKEVVSPMIRGRKG